MDAEFTQRRMPVATEAEQSVLGSILIKPESFDRVATILTADDFFIEEHKQIFETMKELYKKNKDIDAVTLVDALVREGVYDKAGGAQYISIIAQIVPTAANIVDYAKIVKDKSTLRSLITACEKIADEAYSEIGEVEDTLDAAEQRIFEIAEHRQTKNFEPIDAILHRVYENLEVLSKDKDAFKGTATGFSGMDRVLVGMGQSDLVLIGARPGMGKTSFALNIGVNVAKATGKAVAIFSLEMSSDQLVTRVLSSEAMVDSTSLRSGNISEEDWIKLAHAASDLAETNILIDDTTGQTITAMKAKLRRVKNLGLVIIDYLQLMQSDRKYESRVNEVGDISRNLKIMAKELGVPIICCSQLSRGPESRNDKKPMLADLRDSGAIEQDADVVLFLYRGEYYKNDREAGVEDAAADTAEVIIAKNRHGGSGTIKLGWIGRYTKFISIDSENTEA